MNFGIAKMFGATDKRFQEKYNYLIDILSTSISALNSEKTTLSAVMPIGYVYISSVATSPATLFGFGTWTQIKDTFILTAGDTYTAGDTGGAATVTLDTTMIPSHAHQTTILTYSGDKPAVAGADANYDTAALMQNGTSGGVDTLNSGGGLAHNNMPPYKVYYAWERTA